MTSPAPLLTALRASTRSQHDRLEQTVEIFQRCRTRAAYLALLEKFYGFYAPLEVQMAMHPAWKELGMEERRKTPLLERDLQCLGSAPQTLPRCTDLPILNTFAQVQGCAYVLEGATLGGQIIARHIAKSLQIDADNGGAFFYSYGPEVGRRWQAFCARLTTLGGPPGTHEAIIAGAAATFDALERWLSASGISSLRD